MPKTNTPKAPPVILVVEGDVLVRMAVCAYLRECGFVVAEAANDSEALTILQSEFNVDCAFIDLGPSGNLKGFELARWVRRNRPPIRVILTSGAKRTAQEAHDLCGEGPVLPKPYSHQQLEQQIRRLLAQ
jgi:CheY-like chemotaxis protein